MRTRSKRWKLSWSLLCTFQMAILVKSERKTTQEGTKGVIFPRMDYNQWKPLGHGDPLKDDPTFDYVPPVLDHVHYWDETTEEDGTRKFSINQTILDAINKTDSKREILLLGVSSKKPAVQMADKRKDSLLENYPKYSENNAYSNFNQYHDDSKYNTKYYDNQRIGRPSFFPSMSSSVLPSLMNFASKIFDRTAHSKETEPKEPDTILVPPPMVGNNIRGLSHQFLGQTNPAPFITQGPLIYPPSAFPDHENYITSTPSVTIEESNLIYHSSSISNLNEFDTNSAHLSSAPSINWQLPSTTNRYNDFNNIGQTATLYSPHLREQNVNFNNPTLVPPDPFMKMKFFNRNNLNNKILEGAGSNNNINYVTAPPIHKMNYVTPPPLLNLNKPVKFKGHVSDDHEMSNTYVKIEKPQAQMHSTGVGVNNVPIMPSNPEEIYPDIITSSNVNMLTIKDMQTLQPPAAAALGDILTQNPIFIETGKPLLSILKKEQVAENFHDFDKTNFVASESMINNAITANPLGFNTPTIKMEPLETITEIHTSSSTSTTTTTEAPITTTANTLTTDPLFKHYKQPLEPIKGGPLYLIIQGHSKVKTYKPAKQIDGIMIQETNEIPNSDNKYDHIDFDVKHLHHIFKTVPVDYPERQARARNYGNLQTLKHIAQTGYGKIDFVSESFTEPMNKYTPDSIERVLSTMQPTNYNINYNLNRMIKEIKGVPKEVFDALNDLQNGKQDFKNVAEILAQTVTQSMIAVETATESMKVNKKSDVNLVNIAKEADSHDTNVQETEVKSRFEVGNVKDITSERYHKGIVEAARKLML